MVVTNVFATAPDLGLKTLEVLRDTVEGVVAIKDDIVGAFARRMGLLLHGHWGVISGGQKQNHLDVLPYGCDGYFSTFIHFRPDITQEYWRAVQTQDWQRVKEIIQNYDFPYFDFVGGLTGGGDAGIHGTLELFGIAGRWRRKPLSYIERRRDGAVKRIRPSQRLYFNSGCPSSFSTLQIQPTFFRQADRRRRCLPQTVSFP